MAAVQPMSEFFYPKLQAVEALEPLRLRTVWSTGKVLDVDVSHVFRGAAFAEIRKPEVFKTVHTDGFSIEWFDTELGPDNVFAWAKEQAGEVSHEMLGAWMHRNPLSLSSAAEALGISRRMVSYCRTAEKPIPRSIWLACLGWEVTRPKAKMLPR
jgi:Protein of unknown function (DUF2442)